MSWRETNAVRLFSRERGPRFNIQLAVADQIPDKENTTRRKRRGRRSLIRVLPRMAPPAALGRTAGAQ